ncbi:MAG: ATPase [Alphaproteobacteria bacterium]|nr:ATPase [Alphaproteobacteria bacterium]
MRALITAAAAGFLAFGGPARAEVTASGADGFSVAHEADIALAPAEAWARLVAIGSWWSDDHTYSGAAANMTLDPTAGGCFCETWAAGSVAHGRVLVAIPGALLRLDAPLGPLQDRPTTSILTMQLAPHENGARLTLTFVAAGPPSAGLAELAPLVDMVLGEQVRRFVNTP